MIRPLAILSLTALGLAACATDPASPPLTVAELAARCDGLGGVLVPRQPDARRGGGGYVCRGGTGGTQVAAGRIHQRRAPCKRRSGS